MPRSPDYDAFAAWLAAHWAEVEATCLTHATQTNEPGRCAVLLPALAAIPGPLALIEVGASAGLCLHLDRYSYRYTAGDGDTDGDSDTDGNGAGAVRMVHPADGPSPVLLDCRATGPVPIPDRLPNVVWRAGIDLNPLDVNDDADVAWLDALIWPEHADRRARLRAAVEVARAGPVEIVRGDLNEEIEGLVARAPAGATVVVFHTAVLAYLDEESTRRFSATMERLPVRWLSNEGQKLVPAVTRRMRTAPADSTDFVLALDAEPIAFTQPHGRRLHWLAPRLATGRV